MLGEVRPLPDAHDLLVAVKDAGFTVVLASSGPARQVEIFLDLVGGRDVVDGWTSGDDADRSKPAPDLIDVARRKAGPGRSVMIGDSTWDLRRRPTGRHTIPAGADRGFSADELNDAGAEHVVETLTDLSRLLVHAD